MNKVVFVNLRINKSLNPKFYRESLFLITVGNLKHSKMELNLSDTETYCPQCPINCELELILLLKLQTFRQTFQIFLGENHWELK